MTSLPQSHELNQWPKKVAFCITELDPGGAERALVETVTRLDPAQWSPHVFCLGPEGALVGKLASAGIPVHCLGAKRTSLVGAIWRLRKQFRQLDPAIIVTSLFHANFVGRLASWNLGKPVIAGHRVAERRARWHLWLERVTGGLVSHHVMVSESVRQFLIEQHIAKPDNSSVIYNGVDVERFATAVPAEFQAPGPVALYAGRLDQQKGIEILFDAWPVVRHAIPAASLVLAGNGPLRQLVEAAAGQDNSVHWIGFQPDLAPWYRRADVVVLPSLWEGLPNVLLESLVSGTPCVVSDVEGVREVFDGRDQTVVPPGDSAALSAAIIQELSAAPGGEELQQSTQAIIGNRFTWKNCAVAWTQLLDDVVTRDGRC